ncbi:hypothetical protein VQL36_11055 [Chengkuizengella sp. SCS-71B]|uniref:hypothetical protein n=1 Tax=Chengkuizengella sp. SCS-71B TaxID=3115290 RepID=UPI0032C2393A
MNIQKKGLSLFGLLLVFTLVFTLLLSVDGLNVNAEEPGVYLYEHMKGVYLYEHTNYGGQVLRFGPGSYNLDEGFGFDDKLSSLRIVGNYVVVLYQDDWSDNTEPFYDDDPDLSDNYVGNDKVSTIRVFELPADGEGVYLYEHTNYGGQVLRFGPGRYNLDEEFGFDDKLSSLRIVGNYNVTLYQDDWSDTDERFYTDDANLKNNRVGNDKVSTITVIEDKRDWMEQVSDNNPSFEELKLMEVLLPGTHDSGTATFDDGEEWHLATDVSDYDLSDYDDSNRRLVEMFGENEVANLGQAQELTIKEQLYEGARYVDLRVGPFMWWDPNCHVVEDDTPVDIETPVDVECDPIFKQDPTDLRTMHGLYGEKVDDILNGVEHFVTQNPKEIIILDFQHFHEMTETSYDHLVDQLENKFSNQLISLDELQTNTLEQLWSEGKNVVVLFGKDNHANKINPRVAISQYIDNEKILSRISSMDSKWHDTDEPSVLREEMYRDLDNASSEKLYVSQLILTPQQENLQNPIVMNLNCFLNGNGSCPSLHYDFAVPANNVVTEEVNNGFLNDPRTNIIMLDYFNETNIVDEIIKENKRNLKPTNIQTSLTDSGLLISWDNPDVQSYFGPLSDTDHGGDGLPYYVVYIYKDGEYMGISEVSGGSTYTDINYNGQPHNYQLRLYIKASWENILYDSGLIDVVDMDEILKLTNIQTELTNNGLQLSWNNLESAIKHYFGDELASNDHEDGFTPYYFIAAYKDGEYMGISKVSEGTYTDINYDGQPNNYQLQLNVKANWDNELYQSDLIDVVDMDKILQLTNIQTELTDNGLQLSWNNLESAIKHYFGDELASNDHEDGFTPYYFIAAYKDGEYMGISKVSEGTYTDINYDGQPHNYQLQLNVKANWDNELYQSDLIDVVDMDEILKLTNIKTELTESGLQLSWNNLESSIKHYFGDELASNDHEDGFTPYYFIAAYKDGEYMGISKVSEGTYTDINYDGQPHNYQLQLNVKANWDNELYQSDLIDVVDMDEILKLTNIKTELTESGLQLSWNNLESSIKHYFGDELASNDHEDGFTPYYFIAAYKDGKYMGISKVSEGTYTDINYDGQPHNYQLQLNVKANWDNELYQSKLIDVLTPIQK